MAQKDEWSAAVGGLATLWNFFIREEILVKDMNDDESEWKRINNIYVLIYAILIFYIRKYRGTRKKKKNVNF